MKQKFEISEFVSFFPKEWLRCLNSNLAFLHDLRLIIWACCQDKMLEIPASTLSKKMANLCLCKFAKRTLYRTRIQTIKFFMSRYSAIIPTFMIFIPYTPQINKNRTWKGRTCYLIIQRNVYSSIVKRIFTFIFLFSKILSIGQIKCRLSIKL